MFGQFFTVFEQFFPFLCPRVNHSCRSLQKSDREWFAPIAHDKRVMGEIRFFSQANRLSQAEDRQQ